MSLFRYMFDHDILQRADIEELRSKTRRERRRGRKARSDSRKRVEELEDEVGELTLLCQALVEALRESGHLEPARFQAILERIDAEDGVIDGKVTPREEKPPKPSAPRRSRKHT